MDASLTSWMHEMYRESRSLIGLLLVFTMVVALLLIPSVSAFGTSQDTRDGWAAIMEINYYPEGWTDIPTNYNDTHRWVDTLTSLGWQESHILIVNEAFDLAQVVEAIQFLIDNTDENDIALLFIAAHGMWLNNTIAQNDTFVHKWEEIPSQNKLLCISSCLAGRFTELVADDPNPQIAISAVDADEYSWAGLVEEGLPIIGCVWNYFFTNALLNITADTDFNNDVSVEEAFDFAYPLTRAYYEDYVYPYSYECKLLNNFVAPHPGMDDNYEGELSLRLEGTTSLTEPVVIFDLGLVAILASVGVVVVLILVAIVKRR
ncbi:hypothetical protein EU527_07755 [Candidatus Thorarchaeota archaeon]|nr:MAG: hypothetical protein EU527_07755 [Candidatus Thorarchaeota archaeon]